MVNFGPVAAEIGPVVWGTPANFNGSVTARYCSNGHQPNLAVLNGGRHLYSAGRPSRWALAHILVINTTILCKNFRVISGVICCVHWVGESSSLISILSVSLLSWCVVDVIFLVGTKLVICHVLAVCILCWIQDGNITEAIHLGKALFDQVSQWTCVQDTLLVLYVIYVCSLLCIFTFVHCCCCASCHSS